MSKLADTLASIRMAQVVMMNDALAFSISVGIIAFGICVAAGTIGAGPHLIWTLLGLLTVIVGSTSLCLAIRDVRVARLR
jgi:hypothetical protein